MMMYQRTNPRTLLASLTLAAALTTSAMALPTDGQVSNGQVNIGNPINGQMTIQQLSDRAIINWNGFSINATEALRFIQPSQLSTILNRVTGVDPSIIMGSLQANGRVFLINPNGILFGPGSQVNVGGLMASTLNITDDNFLNGRYKFDQVEGKAQASIVNQGTLSVTPGGFLVLTSPMVANQGVILANVGQIALAAGEHTEINFDGQGLINVQVDPATSQAGPVAISNGMLDHMVGSLLDLAPANAMTQLPGGVEIAGGSGRLINTGEIHADALAGQSAGRVVLNSQQATLVHEGSLISANGVGSKSDGGSVQLLSNGLAALDQGASVQAHSGASGDGGFVELSGKGRIWVEGDVDVSAIQGTAGVFLLDPASLTIVHVGPGSLDPTIPGNGNSSQGLNPGGASTVSDTFINAFSSGLLTLQADNTITQNSDAPINMTSGSSLLLTTTTGDINLNSSVNTGSGTLTVQSGNNIGLVGNLSGSTVTLTAGPTGSIANPASTALITANTVNLTGPGGIFGNALTDISNLGSASPLRTNTPVLNVNGTGNPGNVFVSDAQAATINATASGGLLVDANGSVTVGSAGIASTGPGTGIRVTGGDLISNSGSGRVGGPGLTQIQANNIGTTADPVKTSGSTLNLFASGAGGVTISNQGASVVNLNVPAGPVNVTSNSDIGIGNTTYFNPLGTPNTFVTDSNSPLTLTTSNGKIEYAGPAGVRPVLTGSSVNLNSTTGVGSLAPIQVSTEGVNATATTGAINVNNDQFAVVNATSTSGSVIMTATSGITVGDSGISGGAGTNVSAAGALLTTGTSGTVGNGGTTTINAHSLGDSTHPLKTAGSTLNVTATVGGADIQHNGSATVSAVVANSLALDLTGDLTVGSGGIAGSGTVATDVNATGNLLGNGSSGFVGTVGTTTILKGANVGTTANPLKTRGSAVTIDTAGGANLQHNGAATFQMPTSNGDVQIASDNNINIGTPFVHNSGALTLSTTAGQISSASVLGGSSVNLTASGPITANTATGNLNAASSGGAVSLSNNQAATVNATSSQTVAVTTSAGSLTVGSTGVIGQTGTQLTVNGGGDVLGSATGRVGSAGSTTSIQAANIGTSATPVKTAGTQVDLTAGTVHVDNAGPSTFNVAHSGGATDVSILSDSTITLGTTFQTNNASTLNLTTTAGGLAYQATPFTLTGDTVTLSAPTGLGTVAVPLQTDANTLNASATAGSVFINNSGGLTAGGTALNNYQLAASGPITLSLLSAGGTATVNSQGNLIGNGAATNLVAGTANLTASGGRIGSDANNRLNTQAANLNATGPNGVFIHQSGATTASATATSGDVDLNVDGDLTLGLITASGTVTLQTCPTGSILDGNGASNNIQAGGTTTLIAHTTIGTDTDALEVNVASGLLRVAAGGQINGVSINIDGTTPNTSMDVFSPPPGTACFTGLPPGRGIFNGNIVFEPPAPPVDPVVPIQPIVPPSARFLPEETRLALQAVMVNPFLFNEPPFLTDKQRVAAASFTPFYTIGLAFLLDKEDWLRFLQETVVWDIDEDEAKDL